MQIITSTFYLISFSIHCIIYKFSNKLQSIYFSLKRYYILNNGNKLQSIYFSLKRYYILNNGDLKKFAHSRTY